MIYKLAKRSKMLHGIPSCVFKTSPSKKSHFFSMDLRILQDPGSGLMNDLKGGNKVDREEKPAGFTRGQGGFSIGDSV